MHFHNKYKGNTTITNTKTNSNISFAPNVLRDETYFVGELKNSLKFREAISALHDLVISDMRYKPKDKSEYKKWIETQEELLLAESLRYTETLEEKISNSQSKINQLRQEKKKKLGGYEKAKQEYFKYLYERDYQAWLILDPVITVHPDQIFFECFSKDESSYGKLTCKNEIFEKIQKHKCGTTNIDYSENLYNEFQKIREYKNTKFSIDPSGFSVETNNQDFREEKIELPDSWMRGFLQVSSAMNLSGVKFEMHTQDMANILFFLKRNKEKESPRYMEFILEPGKRIKINFKPWNTTIESSKSVYTGKKAERIKIWGRKRLLILERLLHITNSFTIFMISSGMPSFFIANMNEMTFTLALSGWSDNDWSRIGKFDLMHNREEINSISQQKLVLCLKQNWRLSFDEIVEKTNLSPKTVNSGILKLVQYGKLIYDISDNVYRYRELSKDNLAVDNIQFNSHIEKQAYEIIRNNNIDDYQKSVITDSYAKYAAKLEKKFITEITIDNENRLENAKCTCDFYFNNKLYKGPCKHMIALKIFSNKGID